MVPDDAPDELVQLRAKLAIVREQADQARDKALVAEAELLGKIAAAKTTTVQAFTRKRSTRRDFPADLPREQVVIPAPDRCPCCGSDDLSHLPAAVTETLERVPARHKVIQTVREEVSCRQCEKISQPPAPFHVTPRGMFGPHFLANLAFQKYGLHQPLAVNPNRSDDLEPFRVAPPSTPFPIQYLHRRPSLSRRTSITTSLWTSLTRLHHCPAGGLNRSVAAKQRPDQQQ